MNWRTFSTPLILIWLLLTLFQSARTEVSLVTPINVPKNLVHAKAIVVPDDFEKIQEAINNATEGSRVLVKAGTYYENVVVNKSISLVGECRRSTIIDASARSHVVTISANNVLLSGFTFRNGSMGARSYYGINVCNVDNSYISNNTIIGNFVGIKLGDKLRGATGHVIRNNNITKNRYGIFLDHSDGNIISGNIVSANKWNGIELAWCEGNVICANTISTNKAYGLEIYVSTPARHNVIYHNNFINNTFRVSVSGYVNVWDDDYPSGGNYWSEYTGVDLYGGPYQNATGSDGMGDTPYVIDGYNRDRYPLMNPFYPTPPMANFTYSPEQPYAGETVAFNASKSTSNGGFITSYTWGFGDGGAASGVLATHVYTSIGTFTVTLNVTDNQGLWGIQTKSVTIQKLANTIFVDIRYIIAGMVVFVLFAVVLMYFRRIKRR